MALDFFAGCLGGFVGLIVGHPFDTVKVRLQGQDSLHKRYSSTWNCFAQIVKKESVFGLYKGISSPLFGQVLINAVVFGVHGNVLRAWGENNGTGQFIAGAAAGAVQTFVCSPMELIKIRLQMQTGDSKTKSRQYKNTLDCVKDIYKNEKGLRGLSRGFHVTLWRDIPSFGFYFQSYYYLCDKTEAIRGQEIKLGRLLFCGGIAGIISWVCTYPYDVIKTRLQIDGLEGKEKYKGIFDCAKKSYQQEGFKAFFRGLNVTLVRAFPGNGATLATVTIFMHFVGPRY